MESKWIGNELALDEGYDMAVEPNSQTQLVEVLHVTQHVFEIVGLWMEKGERLHPELKVHVALQASMIRSSIHFQKIDRVGDDVGGVAGFGKFLAGKLCWFRRSLTVAESLSHSLKKELGQVILVALEKHLGKGTVNRIVEFDTFPLQVVAKVPHTDCAEVCIPNQHHP